MVAKLKACLNLPHVLVAGRRQGLVTTVAIGVGAGNGLLNAALAAQADVYVTGELGHHAALKALQKQTLVVALGHSASERPGLEALRAGLAQRLCEAVVRLSAADSDPFDIV